MLQPTTPPPITTALAVLGRSMWSSSSCCGLGREARLYRDSRRLRDRASGRHAVCRVRRTSLFFGRLHAGCRGDRLRKGWRWLMQTTINRRTALGLGGAAAMLVAAPSALAQQPAPPAPRVKGPRVWLDLDQTDLDAAYDQSVYAPNLQQIIRRYATNSDGVRARLGAPRRYAYVLLPSKDLTSTRPNGPTRRSMSSFTEERGGRAWRRTTPSRQSCSCTRVRITSFRISSGWRTWAAA